MQRLVLASRRRAPSAIDRSNVERFNGRTAGAGVDSHILRTCCVGCAVESSIEKWIEVRRVLCSGYASEAG
jgi:hypothetical protein